MVKRDMVLVKDGESTLAVSLMKEELWIGI